MDTVLVTQIGQHTQHNFTNDLLPSSNENPENEVEESQTHQKYGYSLLQFKEKN